MEIDTFYAGGGISLHCYRDDPGLKKPIDIAIDVHGTSLSGLKVELTLETAKAIRASLTKAIRYVEANE